jgi:hypothetical protein
MHHVLCHSRHARAPLATVAGLHQGPTTSPLQRVSSKSLASPLRVGFRLLRLLRLLRLRLLIWRASDRAIVASAVSLSCFANHSA